MNCFNNYIGLLGCGNSTPESGLYINSLPGMPLELFDKVTTPEQSTYIAVWNKIQSRAEAKFKSAITSEFAKRYRLKQIQSSTDLGRLIDLDTSFSQSAGIYRGVRYSLEYPENTYYNSSALQQYYVESISLYFFTTPGPTDPITSIPVVIADGDTNEVIDTINFNTEGLEVTVGWNTISVNKFYKVRKLVIAYDSENLTGYSLLINQSLNNSFHSCVCRSFGNDCNGRIEGITTVDVDDYVNVETDDDTQGLSAKVSITCSFESIVCGNRLSFANAYQYLLGAEACVECLLSSRRNFFTLGKEQAQEKHDYFYNEFQNELKLIVDSITLDTGDACLECNQQLQVKSLSMYD